MARSARKRIKRPVPPPSRPHARISAKQQLVNLRPAALCIVRQRESKFVIPPRFRNRHDAAGRSRKPVSYNVSQWAPLSKADFEVHRAIAAVQTVRIRQEPNYRRWQLTTDDISPRGRRLTSRERQPRRRHTEPVSVRTVPELTTSSKPAYWSANQVPAVSSR